MSRFKTRRATRRPLTKSYPAPTRGWIANQNLAEPEPNGAYVLDNMFPETETVRLRAGKQKYATVGDGTVDVKSLFSYKSGGNQDLFAATASAIYDITTVADPDVTPSAAVSGMSNGNWVGAQIQTSGGTYLRLVNGANASRLYDGTTFSTSTIYDSTDGAMADITATFTYTWVYKKRLFFISANLNAWYLPVESIAGAAVKLPLGGVFKLGGTLLFGETWSQDVGDGLNTFCIFGTTEGEVAVFQGSDPSTADEWSHVGTYRIGRPMGKKALFRAGGDLAIATDVGLVALSSARDKDVAALAPAAASWKIDTAWKERVADRGFAEWHMEIWPTGRMVLVGVPSSDDFDPEMLIANAVTGAWCRFDNWDAKCIEVFDERAFIGSGSGKVFLLETTGYDDTEPYTGTCLLHWDDLREPAADKIAKLARVITRGREDPNASVFVNANYSTSVPTAPDAPIVTGESIWDDPGSIWDTSLWALSSNARTRFAKWFSVSAQGDVLAPGIRFTSGDIQPPMTDIVRFDLIYDKTDVVV